MLEGKKRASERENEAHRIGLHNVICSGGNGENNREKGNGENQCEPDQGHGRVEIFHVIRWLLLVLQP